MAEADDPNEAPIRERIRRRSVEVLAHQIRIEREQRRSVAVQDLFASAFFLGLTAGGMSVAVAMSSRSKGRAKKRKGR